MPTYAMYITAVLLTLHVGFTVGFVSWSYQGVSGPENWKINYPLCGGTSQSPVNLTSDHSASIKNKPMDFSAHFRKQNAEFRIINKDYTGMAELIRVDTPLTISGGGLHGTYAYVHGYGVWGESDDVGSDHTVDGRCFPLEIHLVHYNSIFKSYEEALYSRNPEAIAIIAVLVEVVDDNPDPFFGMLVQVLPQIKYPGQFLPVPPGTVNLTALPPDTSQFYRYLGSLPRPPCSEVVVWTVIKNSYMRILKSDLAIIRSTLIGYDDKIINHNNRPLQRLNRRQVSTVGKRKVDKPSKDKKNW